MIDRATFDRVKQRHGLYASWAVWADAAYTPKSNMGDLRVLDPDLNPTLLQTLKTDVIMVGLNISKPGIVVEPFRNFHAPIGGAYKIRYAFVGTPYYGAYMTDFIKGVEMLESGALMRHVRDHPSVVQESVAKLYAEYDDLRCHKPTILTFGGDTYRLVAEHVLDDKYSRLIRIRHYSDYISPGEYRHLVLKEIGSPSDPPLEDHPQTARRNPSFRLKRLQLQDKDETVKHRRIDPRRLAMNENAEKGAHRLQVKMLSYKPRIYQGVCLDCNWRGSHGTGNQAYKELTDHSQATLRPNNASR
jgi:hypothetical protein